MHLAIDQAGYAPIAAWIVDRDRVDPVALVHIGIVARGIEEEGGVFVDGNGVINSYRGVIDAGDRDIDRASVAATTAIHRRVGDAFLGRLALGQGIKLANGRIGHLAGLVDRGLPFATDRLGDGTGAHRFALVRIAVVGGGFEAEGLVFAQGDRVIGHHGLVVLANDGDVHLGLGLGPCLVFHRVGEVFRGGLPGGQVVETVGCRVSEGLAVIANRDQTLVARLARNANDLERIAAVRIAVVGEGIKGAGLVLVQGDLVRAGDRSVVDAVDRHIDPALVGSSVAVTHHIVKAFNGGFTARQGVKLANRRVGDFAFDIQAGHAQVAGWVEDTNGPEGIRIRVAVIENRVELEGRVLVENNAVGECDRQLVGIGGQGR